MNASDSPLFAVVEAQKRGMSRGIYSVCSANPLVLRAAARLAVQQNQPLLVEATSNQVNQEGGYTGMTPTAFAAYLQRIAAQQALPPDRLMLGGDHIGPYPWKALPASQAMEKARRLAADCVRAGYTKIHLDASMACGGDPPEPLPAELVAERAAALCQAAEQAANELTGRQAKLCYVIGTEVPPPGGAQAGGEEAGLQVTLVEAARQTIELTQSAFFRAGLQAAWERVVALVVQPGVEFSDSDVHVYEREKAAALCELIEGYPGLVYEAHSTDYQTKQALRQLVEDHFAILKVGPALTFALRQALFGLSRLEEEWLGDLPGVQLSRLPKRLEEAMLAEPRHWRNFYHGDARALRLKRKYSLSDRWRYYWNEIEGSVELLLENLMVNPPPQTLLGEFLPQIHTDGGQPAEWVEEAIQAVLLDYVQACC